MAAETSTEANTEMAAETSTEANTETTAETEMTTEAITEMAAGASETIPEASSEADAETELSVEETELATEAGAELAGSEYDGYHTGDLEILQKIIESNDALAEYDITKPNTLDWVAWEDEGGIHGNPIRVRSLWLQNRNISGELDLSGLSYLNSLDCYSNPDLTSITSPASVTYIGCHYTGITSLEVSGCPSLEYLYCHGTNLATLDVTRNPALIDLSCGETGITSLDVTNNLLLKGLNCANTQITTLDISQNTQLTSVVINNTLSQFITSKGSITLSPSANGTVSIDTYDTATNSISLMAYEENGYYFSNWLGLPEGVSDTEAAISFTLAGDMTVSAQFKEAYTPLSSLTVKGQKLSPSFDPDVTEYTVHVNNSVSSVTIKATAEDASKIEGTGKVALNVGENIVTVQVYNINGNLSTTYTITINRKAASSTTTNANSTSSSATGSSSTSSTSANTDSTAAAPETGDETMIGLYVTLMAISMLAVVLSRKKAGRL